MFPCRPGTKKPYTANGGADQSWDLGHHDRYPDIEGPNTGDSASGFRFQHRGWFVTELHAFLEEPD